MFHLSYPNGSTEGPYGDFSIAVENANSLLSESVPFIRIVDQDGWIVNTVGSEGADKSRNVPNAADKGKEYDTAKNRMGHDELITKTGKKKKHVLNELPIPTTNAKDGRNGGRRDVLADAGLDLAVVGDESNLPDTHTESKTQHPAFGQRPNKMNRRKKSIRESVQDYKGVTGDYMVSMSNMAFELGQNGKMKNTGASFEEAGESTSGEPDDGIQTKSDIAKDLGQNNKIKNKGGAWETMKEPGHGEPNDGIQSPHSGDMAKNLGQNGKIKNKGGNFETVTGTPYGKMNESWNPNNIATLMEGETVNLQALFNDFARARNVLTRDDFEQICQDRFQVHSQISQQLFEDLLDNNTEFVFHETHDAQGQYFTKEVLNEIAPLLASAAGGIAAAAGGKAFDSMTSGGDDENMEEDMFPPDTEQDDQAGYEDNMGMSAGYDDDAMGMQPGDDFGGSQAPMPSGMGGAGGAQNPMAGQVGPVPTVPSPGGNGLPPEAANGVFDFNTIQGVADNMDNDCGCNHPSCPMCGGMQSGMPGLMMPGMAGMAAGPMGPMGPGPMGGAMGGAGQMGDANMGQDMGQEDGFSDQQDYGQEDEFGSDEGMDECDAGCSMGEAGQEMEMPGMPSGGRPGQGPHNQMGMPGNHGAPGGGGHQFGSDPGQFGGGPSSFGGEEEVDEGMIGDIASGVGEVAGDIVSTPIKMGVGAGRAATRMESRNLRETHEMGMRGEEHAKANKDGIYTTDDTTDNGLRGQKSRDTTSKPLANKVNDQMTYESTSGDATDGITTDMNMADDLGQNEKMKNTGGSNQAMKGDASKLHENVQRLNKLTKQAMGHYGRQLPHDTYTTTFVVACEGVKARSRRQLAEALTDVEELMQVYGAKAPVLQVQYRSRQNNALVAKQQIRFDETCVVSRGPVVAENKVIFRYAEVAQDFADQVVNEGKKCRIFDHNWGAAVTGKFNYSLANKAYMNIPAVMHS